MTQVKERAEEVHTLEPPVHPLEPLSKAEVAAAVEAVRQDRRATPTTRFVSVMLNEPPKHAVINYEPGARIEREAFVVLLDNATGQCVEAIVSLTGHVVTSWRPARRRPARDHAGRVRRVRGGREAVAGVPRSPAEAGRGRRGPCHGRPLVCRRLRRRARGRQGQEADSRACLGALRSDGQRLRPAARRGDRGRRPEQDGGAPRRGLRRRSPRAGARETGPALTSPRRERTPARWRSSRERGPASR